MKRTLFYGVIAVLLGTGAERAHAQSASQTIAPGDLIRVTATPLGDRRIQGRVVRYETQGLVVRESGGTEHSLPLDSIRDLSRSLGTDRAGSIRWGAQFGVFMGGAVGLVSGPLIATTYGEDHFERSIAVAGLGGAALGAAIGAGVGALFPRERWETLQIFSRVGAAQGWGAGLAVRIRTP